MMTMGEREVASKPAAPNPGQETSRPPANQLVSSGRWDFESEGKPVRAALSFFGFGEN